MYGEYYKKLRDGDKTREIRYVILFHFIFSTLKKKKRKVLYTEDLIN